MSPHPDCPRRSSRGTLHESEGGHDSKGRRSCPVEAFSPRRRFQKVHEEEGQSCCYAPALCRCPPRLCCFPELNCPPLTACRPPAPSRLRPSSRCNSQRVFSFGLLYRYLLFPVPLGQRVRPWLYRTVPLLLLPRFSPGIWTRFPSARPRAGPAAGCQRVPPQPAALLLSLAGLLPSFLGGRPLTWAEH